MTNTEKLKEIMNKYNISNAFYVKGMDLDSDFVIGCLFFDGFYNTEFLKEVYLVFTPDGYLQDDQDLDIWMAPKGTNDYKIYTDENMEMLL